MIMQSMMNNVLKLDFSNSEENRPERADSASWERSILDRLKLKIEGFSISGENSEFNNFAVSCLGICEKDALVYFRDFEDSLGVFKLRTGLDKDVWKNKIKWKFFKGKKEFNFGASFLGPQKGYVLDQRTGGMVVVEKDSEEKKTSFRLFTNVGKGTKKLLVTFVTDSVEQVVEEGNKARMYYRNCFKKGELFYFKGKYCLGFLLDCFCGIGFVDFGMRSMRVLMAGGDLMKQMQSLVVMRREGKDDKVFVNDDLNYIYEITED